MNYLQHEDALFIKKNKKNMRKDNKRNDWIIMINIIIWLIDYAEWSFFSRLRLKAAALTPALTTTKKRATKWKLPTVFWLG